VRDAEILVQVGARRALHAVIGPEDLRAVGQLRRLERLLARMRRRERDVTRRVPVLREHDVLERGRQAVDERDDLIAFLHRQRAARGKAVLYVDHEENVLCGRLHLGASGLRRGHPRAAGEPGGHEARGRAFEELAAIRHDHFRPPSSACHLVLAWSGRLDTGILRQSMPRRPAARGQR
jgi:hypothetical protein